jgi:2-polyprenyl-3-methyl-5-hydroxy-6-metoxy-1,4-benzoquinol methylase
MSSIPSCPACDQSKNEVVEVHGAIDLRKCAACGLVFADPMAPVAVEYYQGHVVYAHKTTADARNESVHLDRRRLSLMKSLTAPGAKMLDIGCGSGAFVAFARKAGREAFGIDFNAQEIDLGKVAFELDGYLMTGDLLSMPDGWSDFDLITMFEVIEHLPNPKEVIVEVSRRLKKGGYLILSCPNEKRWMPAGRVFVDYPPHHLTRWSPQTLRRFLERNSLAHVRTEIDASVRDILWTAYVNRRSQGISEAQSPAQGEKKPATVKWFLYRLLRVLCAPFDAILAVFRIGTLGMRVVVRKASS